MSTQPKTKGHPALQDANVRKAIVMAIDRDKICAELLNGLTKPAVTFWDGMPYADTTAKPIPFDKEAAKKLLDDAGWRAGPDGVRAKDGVPLKLRYVTTTREVRKNTQVIVQQMLKEVGIETELIDHSADVFFNGYGQDGPIATGQYDICQWSSQPAFPDPDSRDWACNEIPSDESPAGTNWEFICDQELDALFTKSTAAVDPQARIELYKQISRMLNDKAYWASFWDDPDWWSISKKLLNVKLSGSTPFWNCYEWDLQS
jgi:peptide/nickel transport system substrate-binding protein